MKYLFFDIETTGLPKNYKGHYSDLENWPRIVQLSWLISDNSGSVMKESDNIIKVDFPIPEETSKIHGITNTISEEKGVEIKTVLKNFLADLAEVETIIAHNLNFDYPIVQSELLRNDLNPEIKNQTFCTMLNAVDFCKLPGKRGYKWPRLSELYHICFNKEIENAHNAIMDVRATHEIFHKLKDNNIFKV